MAPNTLSETEREMLKEHAVDIPADFNVAQSPSCCIYRVPPNLREVKPEAYTPQLIAIGPLHRKNKKLKAMEREKVRYFHFFWERCYPNAQELLQRYKSQLLENEERIRHSYGVKLSDYSKAELVNMIFLDAVFIMELFLRFRSWKSGKARNDFEKHDYMITRPLLQKSILRDLLLLENQIPMFVLEELYDTVSACPVVDRNQTVFLELAKEYFREQTFDRTPSSTSSCYGCASKASYKTNNGTKNLEKSVHFTDMIRYLYLPENLNFDGDDNPLPVLKTATQLNEAGVTFEERKNKCLLDIRFKKEPLSCFLCLGCFPKRSYFNWFKARFKIPQLKVDQWTECCFRNLIAFEQCHYPEQPYICNYVSLIDSLIHTKDDVELLVDKGVISHELGSHKELATVVNGLCKYVVVNRTCYKKTIGDLNKHYGHVWNRSMAALRLVYFRDPWRASSTVVGVAVLVFTIFNFCRVLRALH